ISYRSLYHRVQHPCQRRGPSDTTLPRSPHDEVTGALLGSTIESADHTLKRNSTAFRYVRPSASSHSQFVAQSGFSCQPAGAPAWEIGTIVTLGKVFTTAGTIRTHPTLSRSDRNWTRVSLAKVRFHSVAAAARQGCSPTRGSFSAIVWTQLNSRPR